MKTPNTLQSRRDFLRTIAAGTALIGSGAWAQTTGPSGLEIIDVHAHMPLVKFGGPLASRFARADASSDAATKQLASAVQEDTLDGMGNVRLSEMESWGISKTVIMPIDFGTETDPEKYWEEQEAVAKLCREHGDKFIPFLALDPRRADALAYLDRAVNDLQARGIKIHPLAGFAIDDEALCYPFYKKCSEIGVPVLGHCRPVGAGARDNLARPERYAKVATAFPELKICLGHLGGGPWSEEALQVVIDQPNAYGDISTLQTLHENDPIAFASLMRKAMDSPARERIMYGTDWPTQRTKDKAFLGSLRAGLPTEDGPTLTEKEVGLVLGANARRFLNL